MCRLALLNTAHERSQVDTHVRVGFYPQKRTAKEGVRRARFQGAETPLNSSPLFLECGSRSPVALAADSARALKRLRPLPMTVLRLMERCAPGQNLTRVMATAFMAVDNSLKPKFIKLLKTWDENNIFPDAKIAEVRDAMTLMLTNGGVFPEHLQYGGGQGPQTSAHAHMAHAMDVETSYVGTQIAYHNQPQQGVGVPASQQQNHMVHSHTSHQRPSKSPLPLDVPEESSGPRILCPKELLRYALVPAVLLCACLGCAG